MGVVTVGADVGQKRDPTAIAVVEAEWRERASGNPEQHHLVRHLERLPLGTPYPAVAARLAEVAAGVAARTGGWPVLFLDATGVGMPVVDLVRAAGVGRRAVPVYFTHGDRRAVRAGPEVTLGKGWLVSRLQALLQTERLHLPDTAEARRLAEELLAYEVRVDPDANERYGAFAVGAHDDLVTALGLAVQGPVPLPVAGGFRLRAATPGGRPDVPF